MYVWSVYWVLIHVSAMCTRTCQFCAQKHCVLSTHTCFCAHNWNMYRYSVHRSNIIIETCIGIQYICVLSTSVYYSVHRSNMYRYSVHLNTYTCFNYICVLFSTQIKQYTDQTDQTVHLCIIQYTDQTVHRSNRSNSTSVYYSVHRSNIRIPKTKALWSVYWVLIHVCLQYTDQSAFVLGIRMLHRSECLYMYKYTDLSAYTCIFDLCIEYLYVFQLLNTQIWVLIHVCLICVLSIYMCFSYTHI